MLVLSRKIFSNLWFTENRMWMRVMPPKFLGLLEMQSAQMSLVFIIRRWMCLSFPVDQVTVSRCFHTEHVPNSTFLPFNIYIIYLKCPEMTDLTLWPWKVCARNQKNSQGPWDFHSCSGAGSTESQISDSESQVRVVDAMDQWIGLWEKWQNLWKSMVSCKFSPKPIHWMDGGNFTILQEIGA